MTENQIRDIISLLEVYFKDVRKELALIASIYDKEIKIPELDKAYTVMWLYYKTVSWPIERLEMWTDIRLPLNLLFPILVQQYLLFKLESPTITVEQIATSLAVYSRISKRDVKIELLTPLKNLLSTSIF